MHYETLVSLRNHPAWRLLTADSAPLILGFFHLAFIKTNRRAVPAGELIAKLDDYLYHLRKIHGEDLFPRAPRDYLDAWAGGEQGFLRKYYPEKGDEPEYDLTPASEKVIEWLSSLEQKKFVGAESRLLTIFRLLRDIARETATDPNERIAELESQKAEIDSEIKRLSEGRLPAADGTRIREQYLQAEETARGLLFDFRQIEENFRKLDRDTRQRIATSELPKGRLLDEIFGREDAIKGSDQGKSFRAFWSYLMSPASQEELDRLLDRVLNLSELRDMVSEEGLSRIRFRLLEAGEKVNETCALLVEQLRKFLDDQAWLENRRIMGIIRAIEKSAVGIRSDAPEGKAVASIAEVGAEIDLPMTRGLFLPPRRPMIDDVLDEGKADIDSSALFQQHYVDERVLKDRIRTALRGRSQISLKHLCEMFPVEKGLSEIIAYLDLASKDERAMVATDTTQAISWRDAGGLTRKVYMPEVIFTG
jgi:hypothetical protein